MARRVLIFILLLALNGVVCANTPKDGVIPLMKSGISSRLRGGLRVSNPEISVTVGHFGYTGSIEQVLTLLPNTVALAFDVYSKLEKKWVDRANAQDNPIFLTVSPFKFLAGNASAPISLNLYTQESDIEEWQKNVGKSLKGFLVDRNVCQDVRVFAALSTYIKKQNLFLFLSEPGESTETIYSDHPGKCSVGDIVIQSTDSQDLIDRKLKATRLLAEKQGFANLIVFLSNFKMFTSLKDWMMTLEMKKFNFVSIEKNATKENHYG